MVTQRLGFKTIDELEATLPRADVYQWAAAAILQGWFHWQPAADKPGSADDLHAWLNANYPTK